MWRFRRRKLNVQDAAEKFRRRLLAREEAAVRRIRAAYKIAARAIDRDMAEIAAKIDASIRAGLPVSSSWHLQQDRLAALARKVQAQIDAFSAMVDTEVGRAQLANVIAGSKDAQAMAKAAGIGANFELLNTEQFKDLVGMLENGAPLSDLFKELGPRAATHARGVFAQASALGWNPRETAKKLSAEIQGLTETRALVIARDQTMRSYRGATIRTYRANSDVITGWRWQSARQPRTCPMCLAMDGSVHSLDEEMWTHTCCRCMQVPFTEYSTPPKETAAQWFHAQPEEVQRQIVGRTKLELIQSGKIDLQDLVVNTDHPRWGKGRREATISEALANAAANPRDRTPPTSAATKSYVGGASAATSLSRKMPKDLARQITAVRSAIDKIHGAGGPGQMDRFTVPVYGEARPHGDFGALAFRPYAPQNITINSYGPTPELTFAHEFGHLVDFTAAPGPMLPRGVFAHIGEVVSKGAPLQVGSEIEQAVYDFIEAVAESPEVQALRTAIQSGVAHFDGKAEYIGQNVDYYLQPHELWARAYAQFVAVRSGMPVMNEQVQLWIEHPKLIGRLRQWAPDAFAKIEPYIEALLKQLGLMP